MKFSGTIAGIFAAGVLLALLGLTRLLVPDVATVEYDVRDIEIATLPEPPPPPPEEPPPDAPPPPPSLTTVSEVPDPSRIAIPKADIPLSLEMPVDSFFTDVEPAPLPKPVVRKAPPAPKPSTQSKPTPKPPPPPVKKAHYSISELDGKPRLIRHGSAEFPRALAAQGVNQGTVVLEVELSENGAVSVQRTISATHQSLVAPALRVARGSRFTSPTRGGQRVKARLKWPITIKK